MTAVALSLEQRGLLCHDDVLGRGVAAVELHGAGLGLAAEEVEGLEEGQSGQPRTGDE